MTPYRTAWVVPEAERVRWRWCLFGYAWAMDDYHRGVIASFGPVSYPCRRIVGRLWWIGNPFQAFKKWLHQPVVPTPP